jgi:hypothetical protein
MPFSKTGNDHTSEYWTNHFESFLKPLIESTGKLLAKRSEALRGDILRQIITDLVVSPVVVADLTDANPNVYWELGVRQSFKHGTVTIAQDDTPIPFDIGAKGTLFYYPTKHIEMAKFEKRFREAIEDCLTQPSRPDSHVLETISGRGTLFEILHRDEAVRRLRAVLSEIDRNAYLSKELFDQVEINQKNPTNRSYTVNYFGLSAVELLLTNRYVDAEDSFFALAQGYWNHFAALNAHVIQWHEEPASAEDWLLSMKQPTIEDSQELRSEVESIMLQLSKRI